MEIQKLKKRILQEELRRQRKKSKYRRFLVPGILCFLVLFVGSLLYYTTQLDKILETDYAQAQTLLAAGEFEGALSRFEAIYQRHPTFHLAAPALFQAGEILNLDLQRYQEALLAYLLVEKDYPETELCQKAQQQVAEIYKNRLRDYSRAIVAYQKLLDSMPEDGDKIQYEVADIYFRLENFEQARIEFESLLKAYPTSARLPEVTYRIGVTYSLEGKLQRAGQLFEEVLKRWPESPFALEARFGLGSVLEEKEELRAALEVLQPLKGLYANEEVLTRKLEQLTLRIQKKKKAI